MLTRTDLAARLAQEEDTRPVAIVIGAGFGVLAAAMRLGAKGYRAVVIDRLRGQVAERMPVVVQQHFEAMKKRAEGLLGDDTRIDPKDLTRELAVLSERADVSEELSRLTSHLEHLDAVLGEGGEVGRKLDFLVQELYREANTIGSKAGDAEVAHAVVELKTHIERVREQVQNVE